MTVETQPVQKTLFDKGTAVLRRNPLRDKSGQLRFNFDDTFERSIKFDQFKGSLKTFWNSKSVPQKIVGLGGIGGLALNMIMPSEQGFFKRLFSMGLDALAIASVFHPALLLPATALYLLRGVSTLISGGTFAGLMDIGVALMPGLRSMKLIKEVAKRFNNKGFTTAMNYFLTEGYGPKACVQYKTVKKVLSGKEAFKTTVKNGFEKVGYGYGTATKCLKEGMATA